MKKLLVALIAVCCWAPACFSAPEYTIQAIRYASSPGFPVAALVMGAPKEEKIDIAMVVWLIRGGGRNILFDTGFHRESWLKVFPMQEFLRPDQAVATAGVNPDEITDIVISHAHWDQDRKSVV